MQTTNVEENSWKTSSCFAVYCALVITAIQSGIMCMFGLATASITGNRLQKTIFGGSGAIQNVVTLDEERNTESIE